MTVATHLAAILPIIEQLQELCSAKQTPSLAVTTITACRADLHKMVAILDAAEATIHGA